MARKKIAEEEKVSTQTATAAPIEATETPKTTMEETPEERSIAQKLLSLYELQKIYSEIDKIRLIRGELPEEIQDLEDANEGMSTRIAKYNEEIAAYQRIITDGDVKIKEAQALIKRYEEQQNNVRNNREYDSLSKEIEYQKLEIQLAEKHKAKAATDIETRNVDIAAVQEKANEISEILKQKKSELDGIITETEKREAELIEEAEKHKALVDQRLLVAFERIRSNARNGLAIVQIERDACGGCFSTIPPQRQLDIRLHKKIIVCEACGRIFIDKQLVEAHEQEKANE
ncbi:MAG: C4-type zinc ribbon domain-containing protein [Bacteroidales bacterium]|nr:C4-type zinc ribbon domain-containing protein [Bacteroidales bacterium]